MLDFMRQCVLVLDIVSERGKKIIILSFQFFSCCFARESIFLLSFDVLKSLEIIRFSPGRFSTTIMHGEKKDNLILQETFEEIKKLIDTSSCRQPEKKVS